jgi:hypothetical protein
VKQIRHFGLGNPGNGDEARSPGVPLNARVSPPAVRRGKIYSSRLKSRVCVITL